MAILDRNDKLPEARVVLVQYLLFFGVLGLVYGLWQLQILQQGKYAVMAEHNRVRAEPIPASRGKILDRYGRVIVDNYPSFTAYLVRDINHNWKADLAPIAAGLFMNVDVLRTNLARFQEAPDYQPIPIKQDITSEDIAFIAAHRDQYPELETVMVSRRLYPRNGFAAHLLGYVGEASERQVAAGQLHPGAVVGKSGVELEYNDWLMGSDGERRVLVDSRGRVVGELSDTPPQPGHDLRLTIDDDVQIAAEEAIGDRPGAVVALDPRNGEVLAMVSRPTFDPNLFAQGLSEHQWQQWLSDPDKPMMNKALQAQLAPGSVFKLVMAVAGLQENIAENQVVDCKGGATFYGHYYKCWISARHEVHGSLNVTQAITQSCDVYFYTLGSELGIDRIARYATALGLGRATGIDLPNEAAGLIPTPAWQEARFHEPWFRGETINVSIGQGSVMATPLQLARTVGGIAMGGVFYRPHVAFRPGTSTASDASLPGPGAPQFTFPLTDVTVQTVTDGMRGVVNAGGTAASAHLDGLDFGGKTGTAQVISNTALSKIAGSHRQYTDNAWFVGLYPARNPEIAVCVLYERGAEGYYAGRIAAQIVKAYYDRQRQLQQTKVASAAPAGAAVTTPSHP